jgi:alkylation response protein AidB-like acyl-CoA dehydrogenase
VPVCGLYIVQIWTVVPGIGLPVLASVTDPAAEASGISAFVVEKGDEGFSFGAPERKLGIKGSPTCELYFDNCVIPADRLIGEEGEGFRIALAGTNQVQRVVMARQLLN